MKEYKTTIENEDVLSKLLPTEQVVEINDTKYSFNFTTPNSGYILVDNEKIPFCDITKINDCHYEMTVYGYLLNVVVQNPLDSLLVVEDEISGTIHSPMTGVVTAIHVKVGQQITKGQILVVLSAMKMENEIVAPLDGFVAEIKCQLDQQMNSGEMLMEIIPESGE